MHGPAQLDLHPRRVDEEAERGEGLLVTVGTHVLPRVIVLAVAEVEVALRGIAPHAIAREVEQAAEGDHAVLGHAHHVLFVLPSGHHLDEAAAIARAEQHPGATRAAGPGAAPLSPLSPRIVARLVHRSRLRLRGRGRGSRPRRAQRLTTDLR